MWKLSNNDTQASVSEHFQIKKGTFGEKNLGIMFLLPNLICLKETLYFKGQGYGTLLKQKLKIKKVLPTSRIHFKGP